MCKQKKIIDIHEGGRHLICIQVMGRKDYNPYRVYEIISPTGSPVRKRLLTKYGDFMSVIYFIRDYYLYGLNTMAISEIHEWLDKCTD